MAVAELFHTYPSNVKIKLMELRQLIFGVASKIQSVGEIEETLKWGEPSYLTHQSKSGSTIRIHWRPSMGDEIGMYVNCKTDLIARFKQLYPNDFRYEGTRCLLINIRDSIPKKQLAGCISMALTYHFDKKKWK